MKNIIEQLEKQKNALRELEKNIIEDFKNAPDVLERLSILEKQFNNGPYKYSFNESGESGLSASCPAFEKCTEDTRMLKEEALKDLIQESCCAYLENGDRTALYFHSPSPDNIIINEDGDVYQEGKFFINNTDYCCDMELGALIETHMEKTGCFPTVLRSTRYGDLTYFDSNKQAGQWRECEKKMKAKIKKANKKQLIDILYTATSAYSDQDTVKDLKAKALDYVKELMKLEHSEK